MMSRYPMIDGHMVLFYHLCPLSISPPSNVKDCYLNPCLPSEMWRPSKQRVDHPLAEANGTWCALVRSPNKRRSWVTQAFVRSALLRPPCLPNSSPMCCYLYSSKKFNEIISSWYLIVFYAQKPEYCVILQPVNNDWNGTFTNRGLHFQVWMGQWESNTTQFIANEFC